MSSSNSPCGVFRLAAAILSASAQVWSILTVSVWTGPRRFGLFMSKLLASSQEGTTIELWGKYVKIIIHI